MAGIFVTLFTYCIFRTSWDFSLLLGAVATATAPASTIMTIKQYHARGEFVRLLLQIVALDDAVCLLAFSFASAIVSSNVNGAFSIQAIGLPILYNILAIAAGCLCAWALFKSHARRSPLLLLNFTGVYPVLKSTIFRRLIDWLNDLRQRL
ncbi:cation:proton antiporter domain-containing protein [Wansuia hejianensis]|uniref:cation:proton antiporter domain-containing protein n=1 Tax=Wansuia hejianensis TaxID=2763667 RepID=UPI0038CD5E16